MSRTGLIAAGLPKGLWYKASDSVAYTKNWLPHKALGGKTPIEIILAKDPVHQRENWVASPASDAQHALEQNPETERQPKQASLPM